MTATALLVICIVLFLPMAAPAQTPGPERLQARLNNLVDKIARFEVAGMDVLEIPAEVRTRTSVTPDLLEHSFHFRFTVADIRTWSDRPALIAALRSLKAEPASRSADLRWAVIFSDLEKRRVEAIYFDGSGNSGAVGADAASFKGDFFEWLTGKFSPYFR